MEYKLVNELWPECYKIQIVSIQFEKFILNVHYRRQNVLAF